MPQFADCTISIRLSDTGEMLEEYGTQMVDKTVTTWVASESGKEFELAFKAYSYPCSLQLVIFVDGIELVNRGYDRERRMGSEIVCKGVSMDADTVKPFVFSDIVFPEGDASFDHNGLGDVGTIRVEVLQVVFAESRHPRYLIPSLSNDPSQKSSCINGARGIRLGEQRIFRTKKMTSIPYDPSNQGPVAVFKYIYRPRSMLLSQGIIPTYIPRFVEHLDRDRNHGNGSGSRRGSRNGNGNGHSNERGFDMEPEPEPIRDLDSPYSPSIRSITSVEPEHMHRSGSALGHGFGSGMMGAGAGAGMGMGGMGGMGPGSRMGSPRGVGREEAIRRLKEQKEQVERELKELEELRRLKERKAQLQRELEELEHIGFEE